jgi:hypothetical protein
MNKNWLNKRLFIILTIIVIICNIGIFLTLWNSGNKNISPIILPLAFLFTGLFCAIGMLVLTDFIIKPGIDKSKIEPSLGSSETVIAQKEYHDIGNTAMHLFRGLSKNSDLKTIARKILGNIARDFELVQGLFFFLDKETGSFKIIDKFAYSADRDPDPVVPGEGVSGQAIADRKIIELKKVPDSYPQVQSGLGKGAPSFLYIIPLLNNNEVIGLIEMSTFRKIDDKGMNILHFMLKESGSKILSILAEDAR